tara:strand:- start:4578 stop:5414 length:837 start_codon:yes stop_codon:yes gene_type:complete
VVARLRGLTGQRRIGHTGALDPAATGVMILCLGRTTRLVEYMVPVSKSYEGEIVLGITTDTDDSEGVPIEKGHVPGLEIDLNLDSVASKFSGFIQQVPPAYSAIKVSGKRAYSVARSGEKPFLLPREVYIENLTLTRTAFDRLAIKVTCGSGTYIRSIARDIGKMLTTGGHLSSLKRVKNGRFTLRDAHTVSEIEELIKLEQLNQILLKPDAGILDLEVLTVSAQEATKISSGQTIFCNTKNLKSSKIMRCYDEEKQFLGIVELREGGIIHPKKVLIS